MEKMMTKEVEGPIAPHGPFTCEIVFHMTDGENEAQATFDAPVGRTPDEAGLAILAGKALAAVRDQLGGKWRLMRRDEFVQSRLAKQVGKNLLGQGIASFNTYALGDLALHLSSESRP